MGINHGGGNIRMAQKFLNCTDIVTRFQEMGGKGMSERVTTDPPGYSCTRDCLFDGLLREGFVDMMPSDRPASRIHGKPLPSRTII